MSHEFCKELLVWKKHLKNIDLKMVRLQETATYLRERIKRKENELKQRKQENNNDQSIS